jgi:hypothetical protein
MQRFNESERVVAGRILDSWSSEAKNDTRDLRRRRWCRHRSRDSRPTPFTSDMVSTPWR